MYFLALDLTWTPPTTLAPYSYTEAWKARDFFSSVTPQTRKSLLFNYFTSTSRTAGLGLAESQVKKIIKRTKNPNTVTTNIQWIGNFFKFTLDLSHTKFPAKGQSFRLQQSYHFQQLQQNQVLGNVSLSPSSYKQLWGESGTKWFGLQFWSCQHSQQVLFWMLEHTLQTGTFMFPAILVLRQA